MPAGVVASAKCMLSCLARPGIFFKKEKKLFVPIIPMRPCVRMGKKILHFFIKLIMITL